MQSGAYEWYFRLFGGLEAQSGSLVVTRFRTVKTALLLGYLIAHPPHRFGREHLADLLWPDSAPEQGRASLSVCLNSLRNALQTPHQPSPLLLTDRTQVGLNTEYFTSDVQEFEQLIQLAQHTHDTGQQRHALEQAVQLYQGEFLRGYYTEWVTEKSLVYQNDCLKALEQLVMLDREEPSRVVHWLHKQIELDPFNPEPLVQLVQLNETQGHSKPALKALESWCERWAREIGGNLPRSVQTLMARMPQVVAIDSHTHLTVSSFEASRPDKPVSSPLDDRPPIPAIRPLPRPALPCFGREREIQQVVALLRDSPCVTLVGLGGIGKTRLALEIAHHLEDEGGHPIVCWVNLLTISHAEEIPNAITDALGLPRTLKPVQQLAHYLQQHPDTLFILDNLEHLMPEAQQVMAHLFEEAPQWHGLLTSRIPLSVPQEQRYELQPLALNCSFDSPALQMFEAYARRVRPDFRLTENNLETLYQLCSVLEGIPLALELASARLTVLTPRQMLEQMNRRLDWLRSRRHVLQARHQSFRAVLDTTMNLLSEEARNGFARLAVFPKVWTVEQVQQVCFPDTPTATVQDWLEEWLEAGLVRHCQTSEEVLRYTLLEVVREYAEEHLEPDLHAQLRRAHRDWVLATVQKRHSEAYSQNLLAWLTYWDEERLNLWQAIETSFTLQETSLAVQLLWTNLRYFLLRPWLNQALAWLERTKAEPMELDTQIRAGVLHCNYLFYLERFQECHRVAQRLAELCPHTHPLHGWALYWPMHSAYMVHDRTLLEQHHNEAEKAWQNSQEPSLFLAWSRLFYYLTSRQGTSEWIQQALERAHQSGDPLLIRDALDWQLEYLTTQGEYERALQLLDTLVQNPLTKDDLYWYGAMLIAQAYCAFHLGDLDTAEAYLQERLELDPIVGYLPEATLIFKVNLLRLRGRYDEAMQLAEQLLTSQAVRESLHLTASTLEALTRVALDLGKGSLAESSIRRAMALRLQEADEFRIHSVGVLLSAVLVRTNPEEALREIQSHCDYWQANRSIPQRANALLTLAEVFLQLGQTEPAEEHLSEATALNQQMARKIPLIACQEMLARIRYRQGNREEADALLIEAERQRVELGTPRPPAWQL